jgi:hypothetical protein
MSNNELEDYYDYLDTLNEVELQKEVVWLESIGRAKANNLNLVVIDHFYNM